MVRPPSMDEAEKERQPACKPGSVWPGFCPDATAIPLGRPSPGASSNQPERQGLRTGPRGEPARRSYSVLLPAGLAMPPTSPPARCALAAPFHPCLRGLATGRAVCFLWRFPWGRPRRTLSGAASVWSPDFPPQEKRRPSGRLAYAAYERGRAAVKKKAAGRSGRGNAARDRKAAEPERHSRCLAAVIRRASFIAASIRLWECAARGRHARFAAPAAMRGLPNRFETVEREIFA